MNLNRFKQLLESQMGDVKPLISEQSRKLKEIIDRFYEDESDELRLPEKWAMGDLYYTYEHTREGFWFSFDEYFKEKGQNPPTKVYIGDNEIIRP